MFKNLLFALTTLVMFTQSIAQAQEDLSSPWEGEWIVDGTLFRIGIDVEGDRLSVRQIESLGFQWTSKNGMVDGNIVTVEVEYAGAIGRIEAALVDPDTAVAFAASCLPDFMVICLLAKDQQAVFKRVGPN